MDNPINRIQNSEIRDLENHEDVEIIEITNTTFEDSAKTTKSISSPSVSSVNSNNFNQTEVQKLGRDIMNFRKQLIERLKVIASNAHAVEGDDVTYIQETKESFYETVDIFATFGGFYRELFYDEQYEQGDSELIKDGFMRYLNEV